MEAKALRCNLISPSPWANNWSISMFMRRHIKEPIVSKFGILCKDDPRKFVVQGKLRIMLYPGNYIGIIYIDIDVNKIQNTNWNERKIYKIDKF